MAGASSVAASAPAPAGGSQTAFRSSTAPFGAPTHLFVGVIPGAGRRYIAVVACCGAALSGVLVGTAPWRTAAAAPLFWLMLACAVAGELIPLRVPFRGDFQRITLSTTFVFVLLLEYGIGVAIGAQVVVSVVDDVLGGKALYKIAFNAAQYSLAVAAAGA